MTKSEIKVALYIGHLSAWKITYTTVAGWGTSRFRITNSFRELLKQSGEGRQIFASYAAALRTEVALSTLERMKFGNVQTK